MKRFLLIALFVGASACLLQAQVKDTTVCAILKNPVAFNGKMVRIKGTVSAGFDQFIVRGPNCGQKVDGIWLAYPKGTKGKAGPDALLELQPAHNFKGKYTAPERTPVRLNKDKAFKNFDKLLSKEHHKGANMCMGCRDYEVSATLVGRLDGVADASLKRDSSGKIVGFGGFGNLNAYPARLVLQSVSNVTPKKIDYSKIDKITKGEARPSNTGGVFDPVLVAHRVAKEIGNSPAGIQAVKDADALGKSGSHNGVNISYGTMNEVSSQTEGLGSHNSPDGVLFNLTFDMGHLNGNALVEALLHEGQQIQELRHPTPHDLGAPLYYLEFNAWAITTSASMAARQKFLTLPGGYIIWDAKWPRSDIGKNFSTAMDNFLTKQALLSK